MQNACELGIANTLTMPMANQLPPGQQQIYDHFDTESSYSLDDLAEAFLQYSKRDIGRFLARLRGRGFLRYEELSGLYTRVPEHERDYEERPVEDEDEEPIPEPDDPEAEPFPAPPNEDYGFPDAPVS